jgi:hypothetical protein
MTERSPTAAARRKKGSGLGGFIVLVIIVGAAVFGYHAVEDEMKTNPFLGASVDSVPDTKNAGGSLYTAPSRNPGPRNDTAE